MTFFIAGASLALAVGSAAHGASGARAAAGATVAAVKSNQEIDKYNQQGENAKAGLAQFITAMNNNKRLKAGGDAWAAAQQNRTRNKEAAENQSLEARIAEAEQSGAYAANAASKGQGGSAVAIIDMAMELRNSRAAQSRKQAEGYIDYDTTKQLAGIMSQTIDGLDQSVHGGGSVVQQTAPQSGSSTDWAGVILNSGIIKTGAGWMSSLSNSSGGNAAQGLTAGGGLGLTGSGSTGMSAPSSGFWSSTPSSFNYSLT